MDHETYSDDYIAGVLKRAGRIAIVGASDNPARASNYVMAFLQSKGHAAVPVNPLLAGQEINGETVAASLADVDAPVHMVDVFRNSDAALDIVRAAIREKDRLGIQSIWMQLGVRNDAAAREAEAAGLQVVMNRCPKIEYARLGGRI